MSGRALSRRVPRALLPALAGVALLAVRANASEPEVAMSTVDSTTVRGTVLVRTDAERALALVRDPLRTREAADAELRVEARGADGPCRLYAWIIPTFVGEVSYVGRMCDAPDGATVSLVQSQDFDHLEARWEVVRVSDGAIQLSYQTSQSTVLPVPDWAVRMQTRREVETTLEHMRRWLENPGS